MQSPVLVPAFAIKNHGAHLETLFGPNGRSSYRDSKSSAIRPTIIIVHGGFVDSSGWQGVATILRNDGYPVGIVQSLTGSLADDAAATRRVLDMQSGPVILVGHSYGGVVITEMGNDPKVVGLVFIAAFAPDKGESVAWLIQDPTPGAAVPLLPWSVAALTSTVTEPAWRKKPSWYLVAADDKMIPPRAQWAMAKRAGSRVTETGGSHVLDVSKLAVVAAVIAKAARHVALATIRD